MAVQGLLRLQSMVIFLGVNFIIIAVFQNKTSKMHSL